MCANRPFAGYASHTSGVEDQDVPQRWNNLIPAGDVEPSWGRADGCGNKLGNTNDMIGETLLFIGVSRIIERTPPPPQRQKRCHIEWSDSLTQKLEKRVGFERGF